VESLLDLLKRLIPQHDGGSLGAQHGKVDAGFVGEGESVRWQALQRTPLSAKEDDTGISGRRAGEGPTDSSLLLLLLLAPPLFSVSSLLG